MLSGNFNLVNTCAPHATSLRTIMHAMMHAMMHDVLACVFGRINFGDLVKNSPIHQIEIPAKVSGYTVWMLFSTKASSTTMCTLSLQRQEVAISTVVLAASLFQADTVVW